MMPRILLGCLFLALAATAAAAVDPQAQRESYTAALAAVRAGDEAGYRTHLRRLDDYVLRGYVQYEHLKDRTAETPVAAVRKFLQENTHTPLPDALRQKWLRGLAARGEWAVFMREYVDSAADVELTCLYLGRRLQTGDRTAAVMNRIETLWATGRRLPAACNPVFVAWKQAGHMTLDKIWERVGLAMEARELTLARDLAAHLPPAQRIWVDRWQAMHRDPVRGLNTLSYPVETPVARMIVKHGIVRLAHRDPEEAMRQWERLRQRHQFFGEDEDYVLRYIGILAAQNRLPVALKWLSAVSAQPDDLFLKHWRVYAALWAGDWDSARRFIATLPEEEQRTARWRYWTARAQEQKGNKAQARAAFTELARERDYYGFLAADRVGNDYAMQHVAVDASAEEIGALQARPAVRAAKELYRLGETVEARRQWRWALQEMNNRELQVAAVIARQWGWYDRAIQTVLLSGHTHDLELRFPVLYRDVIEANAAEYQLDPGWIYGVVRQESAFVVDARSSAGALGLMQLLPSTGRDVLRRLKLRGGVHEALLSVEHNVRVGVGYLKQVLERYGGHQVLATASYNAGPNRVSSWIPNQTLDADVWIETIPFNETRSYVKNVLAFAAVYEYRLGTEQTRLSARMPAVTRRAGSS